MKNKPSRQVQRARRRAGLSTPQGQRGAAAVFAVGAILAGLLVTVLAINVGMLYYAQRDLQRLATLGAMAGVQVSSGCRNSGAPGVPGNLSLVTAQVLQGIKNNNQSSDGTDNGSAALLTGIGGSPAVQGGKIDDSSGIHTFAVLTDGSQQIDAVRVNLTKPAPGLFSRFLSSAPVVLMASSTAREQPLGAFSIGSTLANLNTANSALLNPILGGLLGTTLNLSAVDYQGLAQTQLSLANLMVAANVTDLSQLLAIDTNAAGLEALLAAATATVNPSVANLLTGLTLGSTQGGADVPLATLLGNIGVGLNPTVNDVAANVPFINVLDMLQQIGEAAAGKTGITIALTPAVTVPGLANINVFLKVLEPPQVSALGPVGTSQSTAQIRLMLRANVDTSGVLGLLSALAKATINLGVDVDVAAAQGTISSLICPSDSKPNPSATVAVKTGLVLLTLGGFSGNPATDPSISAPDTPLLNVTLLGLPIVTLGVKQPVNDNPGIGSGSGTTTPFTNYTTPTPLPLPNTHSYIYQACNDTLGNPCAAPDPTNPQTPVSSTNIAAGITALIGSLAAKNNLQVDVLGIGLGGLLDPIIAALNTALLTPVTSLVDGLLNPLLALLGVQVGSGTVLWEVFESGQPIVVTNCLPITVPKGTAPPANACPTSGG